LAQIEEEAKGEHKVGKRNLQSRGGGCGATVRKNSSSVGVVGGPKNTGKTGHGGLGGGETGI